MKRILCLILSVTMLLSVTTGLNLTVFAASEENSASQSDTNHKPTPTEELSYSRSAHFGGGNAGLYYNSVLLIQSADPWDTTSNVDELTRLVNSGKLSSYDIVSMKNAKNKDFSEYSLVIIANDQSYDTYMQYARIKNGLEKYVSSGGNVLFGACDNGWAHGDFKTELPGSVSKYLNYAEENYIVDASSPIVSGSLTGKSAMTDDMLIGNYCSHTCFNEDSLPENAKIIIRDEETDDPTLVEYDYGSGNVIASGLTWEFYYDGQHSDSNHGYADYYRDLILYALSLKNKDGNDEASFSVDSNFTIGVNSNSFAHSNSSGFSDAGFLGVKNYKMSQAYYDRLVNHSSRAEKSAIKSYIDYGGKSSFERLFTDDYWGGSCYGIATTMGMVYENYLSLKQLSNTNAVNYFRLPYPYKKTTFLDAIQYFQVSQMLRKGGKISSSISYTVNDSDIENQEYNYDNLRTFLKKMVQTASNGDVSLFGFSTEDSGHAVLITGCEADPQRKMYRVKIFDENTVGNGNIGRFSYLEIPYSFRAFNWDEENLNNLTYVDMFITDWSRMKQFDGSTSGTESVVDDTVTLNFSSDQDIFIQNSYGETLNYCDGQLSGDMTVYSIETFSGDRYNTNGAAPSFSVTVDDAFDFEVSHTGKNLALELYDDEDYLMLSAEDLDGADISLKDGIDLYGDQFKFTAYLSTDEEVEEDENNLVSVSANALGNTYLYKGNNDTVQVDSDNNLKDIVAGNVVGVQDKKAYYGSLDGFSIAEAVEEHEHDYDDGVIVLQPSCVEEGIKKYTCSVCGGTYREYIPSLGGHIKKARCIAASFGKNGRDEVYCTRCKDVLSYKTINAPKSIKLSTTTYTYNGKVKTPSVTVTANNGKALKKGTDYTVTYPKGRTNIGTYTVKINFKGKYKGSRTASFIIVPPTTAITKLTKAKGAFTAKWKKLKQINGYQLQYSVNSNFSKAKTVNIGNYKTASKKVAKLSKKKKYYVRIRTYKTVNRKKYYSPWSKAKTVVTK